MWIFLDMILLFRNIHICICKYTRISDFLEYSKIVQICMQVGIINWIKNMHHESSIYAHIILVYRKMWKPGSSSFLWKTLLFQVTCFHLCNTSKGLYFPKFIDRQLRKSLVICFKVANLLSLLRSHFNLGSIHIQSNNYFIRISVWKRKNVR